MYRLWCGKPCCECANPCKYDESMPCSPDCENLGENGEFTEGCKGCEVYENYTELTWGTEK